MGTRARGLLAPRALVAVENERGNVEIHLFVESAEPDAVEVIRQLKSELLRYGVPACVAGVEALPLNANGKIDRAALQPLVRERSGAAAG